MRSPGREHYHVKVPPRTDNTAVVTPTGRALRGSLALCVRVSINRA